MTAGNVAIIDIGKTNAKLALVDLADLNEIAVITHPNEVINKPPWPHFDTEGHWDFFLYGLKQFHAEHGVSAISVTAHGAGIALLDRDGNLAAPILDYEHTGPDETAKEYNEIRPPFSETGSPRLKMGLNIGAQLFWQFRTDPELKERTKFIVTYPQYWSGRLTGIPATEATSLGTHTDLWNPHVSRFSSLVERLGITGKMSPTRSPQDILGTILPEISERTGLPANTPVHCGIHDSNASLLPYILSRKTPFSVVSTGTWVIAMACGGKPVELQPELDTLINVNALGNPVPSARFMGGREYDLVCSKNSAEPSAQDIESVLSTQTMLLPALVPEVGPFMGRNARWIPRELQPGSGEHTAAVGFYLALVTARCLELIGHEGPVFVEGPFAGNRCYCRMLAVASQSEIVTTDSATGTSQGAALLAGRPVKLSGEISRTESPGDQNPAMDGYAMLWKDTV